MSEDSTTEFNRIDTNIGGEDENKTMKEAFIIVEEIHTNLRKKEIKIEFYELFEWFMKGVEKC